MVFLASVFTHMLPDGVANYITEISRVLKPGGRCVATFFLLNPRPVAADRRRPERLDFTYPFGFYRVIDPHNPEQGSGARRALGARSVRRRRPARGGGDLRDLERDEGSVGRLQDALVTVKE